MPPAMSDARYTARRVVAHYKPPVFWRMAFGTAFWPSADESEIPSTMRSTNLGTGALRRHPYLCSRHP
jgi:hypothetical protein